MNHRLTSFVVTMTTLFLFSCGAGAKQDAVISGVVKNAEEGTTLYLESLGVANVETIDSVKLDASGHFVFNPQLGAKAFYRINKGAESAILLALDSNDKVVLTLDAEHFGYGYEVSGSEDSRLLAELSEIMYSNFLIKDSLNRAFRENNTAIDQQMVDAFGAQMQTLDEQMHEEIRQFIATHGQSIASLVAIEQLDFDKDIKSYKLVDEKLAENYANSPYYNAFHQKVTYNSRFSVGSEAPDIILPNPEGKNTSLSSLRGKVVLIDFWASWCKPCRMENPNVVRMYNNYKDKNFEIFGVSLDRERNAWLQAIEQDNMSWMHVSDLMFWQSPVVNLYNVRSIPHTVLIDENGVIIAKNLRGKALEEKLKELFG